MYSKETLIKQLYELGIRRDDVLLVHSSMKSLGEVDGGAEMMLDILMDVVSNGMLVLPTHTWATMSNEHQIYDPEKEPACVGILPNLFLKRKGVRRSLHPTHSLAAYCKDLKRAEEFLSGEENFTTPCNRKGCYGKLYDMNAKILLLGVGLNRNTYMHGVEEWFGLTERLTQETLSLKIKIKSEDGMDLLIPVQMHKHFKPDNISISENYIKLKQPFLENGAMVEGYVGDAKSMLMSAKKVAEITTSYLKCDSDYFLNANSIM